MDEFDFVELPLDLYADAAQSALLDPARARLQEIAAAKPCTWRGTALSLGSVETPEDPAPQPWVIAQIQRLLAAAHTTLYSDAIGFRCLGGRELGRMQRLPYSETAAEWTAARYAAARTALGHPFTLELCTDAVAAPQTGWDAARFLHHIAARTDCQFVLDAGDLARLAEEASIDPAEMAHRLPGERIAAITISGAREEHWALLAMLLGRIPARAVIVRRDCNLFPLDAIERDMHRAAELLGERQVPMSESPRPVEASASGDAGGLTSLRAYQAAFIDYCLDPAPDRIPPALVDLPHQSRAVLASSVQSWHIWRAQLQDAHKAHQIAQFLAQDAGRNTWQGE